MGQTYSTKNKDHRNMVYGKYNGHCAFCGDQLGPRWQVWVMAGHDSGLRAVDQDGQIKDPGQNDLPACISCNTTRLHHSRYGDKLISIEQFRQCLYQEFEFLAKHSPYATYYQKALRFGLIQELNKPIVFYFERVR